MRTTYHYFADDERTLLSFMLSRSDTWMSVAISLSRDSVTPTRIRVVVDNNYPKMAWHGGERVAVRL